MFPLFVWFKKQESIAHRSDTVLRAREPALVLLEATALAPCGEKVASSGHFVVLLIDIALEIRIGCSSCADGIGVESRRRFAVRIVQTK